MSGFFTFVLIVQTLVAVTLIALILMQRSEGGGLAGGGSPAGMMSARGASDFLTRGTAILATIFVALSILLAGLAAGQRGGRGPSAALQSKAPATAPARPAAQPAGPAAPPAGQAAPPAGQAAQPAGPVQGNSAR